jgi:hypothetical protein
MADKLSILYLDTGKRALAQGYVTDHHSGYHEIPLDEEVVIEDKKQMLVLGGHFKISGFLKIDGELRIRE